jgi:hypothetical protein
MRMFIEVVAIPTFGRLSTERDSGGNDRLERRHDDRVKNGPGRLTSPGFPGERRGQRSLNAIVSPPFWLTVYTLKRANQESSS